MDWAITKPHSILICIHESDVVSQSIHNILYNIDINNTTNFLLNQQFWCNPFRGQVKAYKMEILIFKCHSKQFCML